MSRRTLSRFALIFACVTGAAQAQLDGIGKDGWYSWDAPAVEGLPDWCCYSRRDGELTRKSCRLGRSGGFTVADNAPDMGDHVRLFAHIGNGTVQSLRALSPSCPVRAPDEIRHLGPVATGASLEWLSKLAVSRSGPGDSVIAAIAAHEAPDAVLLLQSMAGPDAALETRKQVVFWLLQTHAAAAESFARAMMFEDPVDELRLHAAFALSHSGLDGVDAALIRLGRTDKAPDVRSGAWFWLAQTGSTRSEPAILGAIASDPSKSVREESVFALSQLPESRATVALIDLVRDAQAARGVRQKALFWLAQSGDDAALRFLESVIDADAGT